MGKVTNNFPKKTYFCLINLYAMKITIVSGARPNFMKIAPITRAIKAAQEAGKKISYRLIYTGRQDDTSLDASLFSDLDMKRPDGFWESPDTTIRKWQPPSCLLSRRN